MAGIKEAVGFSDELMDANSLRKYAEGLEAAAQSAKVKMAEVLDDLTVSLKTTYGYAQETVDNVVATIRSIELPTMSPQYAYAAEGSAGEVTTVGDVIDSLSTPARQAVLSEGSDLASVSSKLDEVAGVADDIIRDGSHFDEAGRLKPNVKFESGEHHYQYATDDLGRIDQAHADDLQLKLHDGRLRHNPNTLDKEIDDHAGHIFGDLFGGSPELDNLVSQAKKVNQSGYRRIERQWENALKSNPPKKVEVDIKINYEGTSKRPTSFEVNYKIDGEPHNEIIANINQ